MPGQLDDGDADASATFEETALTTKTKIEIGHLWGLMSDANDDDPKAIEDALGPRLNPPRWSDKLSRKVLHLAHANPDFEAVKTMLRAEVMRKKESCLSHATAKAVFDSAGYTTPNPGKPKKAVSTAVRTRSAIRASGGRHHFPSNSASISTPTPTETPAATPTAATTITVATSPPSMSSPSLPRHEHSSVALPSPLSRPSSSLPHERPRSPPIDPRLSSVRSMAPPEMDRLAMLAHATTMTTSSDHSPSSARSSVAGAASSSYVPSTPDLSRLKRAIDDATFEIQRETKRMRREMTSLQEQIDDLEFETEVLARGIAAVRANLGNEEKRLEVLNTINPRREQEAKTVIAELEQLTTRFPLLFEPPEDSNSVSHAASLHHLLTSLRAQGIDDREDREKAEESIRQLKEELQAKEARKTEVDLDLEALKGRMEDQKRHIDRFEAAQKANLAVWGT